MSDTTSFSFTLDELWLLQSCIRHDIAQPEQWKFPPASLTLNDQIAETILFCDECGKKKANLLLTRHDCLVIDFWVPQTAKDSNGIPIGKNVLLKSFAARRKLEGELPSTNNNGQEIDRQEVADLLSQRPGQDKENS